MASARTAARRDVAKRAAPRRPAPKGKDARAAPAPKPAPRGRLILLVGTRKGAFLLHADASRRRFTIDGPHFLGNIIHHVMLDPRDGRTLLAAAKTGHLGPTIFRSPDLGRTWQEAARPPAFPKSENPGARAVQATFWLAPGHASQPEVWWAGTIPHGLFRSEDRGATWEGIEGFNRNPVGATWGPPYFSDTPEGGITHSILIDPRDTAHMYVGLSIGGVFETADAGTTWRPLNKGLAADFLPDEDPAYGHDPHCIAQHPLRPDRLYQANHCGIYRLDRPGDTWTRIGRAMPREIGDIGFPIVLHPRDPDVAWVFPMDGTTVWPRTSPGGRPAVYRTRDAGRTWERQDRGLPRAQAWFTVKRQAMAGDTRDPMGLYFGTTSGEVWGSVDEGRSWQCIAAHLPHIYAVAAAEVPAVTLVPAAGR